MSTPTAVSVQINSTENVVVTMSDGTTLNAGSFTNAVGNKNAPVNMLHDALAAYVAGLQSQITTATAATTTAQNATTALQAKVDQLVADAVQAGSNLPALQAVVAEAVPLSTASILKASQARQAAAQAALAKEAKLQASLTPATPAPTVTP